jgi:predicted DNA-binding transcriptional regulator YafY
VAIVAVKRTYDAPYLRDLLQASLDKVHLRISYDSRRAESARLIYPYGLIAGLGFWYCACYDYKREAHIWLRVDRINALERAEELAPREAMSMSEWMQLSPDEGQPMVQLNASVTSRGMKELDWSDFADAFAHHRNGSATIKKMVPASSIDFYARIFVQLGSEVVVKSPPELVEAICAKSQSVLSLYKNK